MALHHSTFISWQFYSADLIIESVCAIIAGFYELLIKTKRSQNTMQTQQCFQVGFVSLFVTGDRWVFIKDRLGNCLIYQ